MKVIIGGVEHEAVFTLLDMRDLGRQGVMAQVRKFSSIEEWERLDVLATFIAMCVRRAGGSMTADELLLTVKPTEMKALYDATLALLANGGNGEGADPNAPSPGTTAT